jgi:hypothetical protein
VHQIVENPGPERTAELYDAGALENTLVLIARGTDLCRAIARRAPLTWAALTDAWGNASAMEAAYGSLPAVDLSSGVLAPCPEVLRVLALTGVRWSDLDTPSTLRRIQREWGIAFASRATARRVEWPLSAAGSST